MSTFKEKKQTTGISILKEKSFKSSLSIFEFIKILIRNFLLVSKYLEKKNSCKKKYSFYSSFNFSLPDKNYFNLWETEIKSIDKE